MSAGFVTIHEFDALVAGQPTGSWADGVCTVPAEVFKWLDQECLRASEAGEAAWMRFAQRRGRRAVQVTSHVGVIRVPGGFHVEVLPKVGKANAGPAEDTRRLLIRMLSCLPGFRHIATEAAALRAARMPLLDVFIAEFLDAVKLVIKRGLRSTYVQEEGNVAALRGKLQVSRHLVQNLVSPDRFYTEHDDFTTNRPENRLLHAALQQALSMAVAPANQRLARELLFAIADVPVSIRIDEDFRQVNVQRDMSAYEPALAWARLILDRLSPLTAMGSHRAPSLLFPMDAVFEAFVARHLREQFPQPFMLKAQARSEHLVRHLGEDWFRLKPDLLLQREGKTVAVLDTKWKLLEGSKANGADKYGLSQADFYQLKAYGHTYLDGQGDLFLVFPQTDLLNRPLPLFEFPSAGGLRLWVAPFCLKSERLRIHEACPLAPGAVVIPRHC